jgi:hypothetical protein
MITGKRLSTKRRGKSGELKSGSDESTRSICGAQRGGLLRTSGERAISAGHSGACGAVASESSRRSETAKRLS